MADFNVAEVEEAIIDVISKITGVAADSITMDSHLADIRLTSMQVISVSALLEEKLGYGPNFRALIGMEKVSDIRDYIMR